ncbi:3'-5' exonuclease [Planotetraspora kaengkrachanensis]|uniref:DNA polymerase III n=1 Tax=Planotetraspora kaengkrachanensis TaxID=575193 RepID=A0A8J3PSA3_9ACTN|nr:3'-5' exonuclease [Planotetraspora kaengkrachanensis]GIG80686.1 DNA polymerase III [Planotetraspora kaengkrachanensis]
MESFGRFLNVVDVEATCWDGPPPPGQTSEIIEIGLCVVDLESLERVSRHRLLVRPARSKVSEVCTELTGLTQREVDGGVGFQEACDVLRRDHHARCRTWTSWGDYDRRQFERQRASGGYPFGARHVNTKLTYSETYGLTRRLGMKAALEHAELPLEGRHHSGADDAWNIGALVLRMAHARRGRPDDPWAFTP